MVLGDNTVSLVPVSRADDFVDSESESDIRTFRAEQGFFFFCSSYNLLIDVVLYDRRKETKEEEKKVRCFISCLRLRGVGVINSLIEHDQGTTRIIQ